MKLPARNWVPPVLARCRPPALLPLPTGQASGTRAANLSEIWSHVGQKKSRRRDRTVVAGLPPRQNNVQQHARDCQSISHVQSKPKHVQTQVSTSEKQIAHNLSNLPIFNPSPAESPRCGPRGRSPPAATPRAAPPAGPGALPWDPSRRYAPGHAGEPRRRSEVPRSPRSNPPGSWLGKKKEHTGLGLFGLFFHGLV